MSDLNGCMSVEEYTDKAMNDAKSYITTLEAKLAVAREALGKVAACETSINGRIAREALSAMIAAATLHDDGGE